LKINHGQIEGGNEPSFIYLNYMFLFIEKEKEKDNSILFSSSTRMTMIKDVVYDLLEQT
jgi:hypothetical protein